jgi:tripartite-type tricarboxylate transporter receptor subunit TctC
MERLTLSCLAAAAMLFLPELAAAQKAGPADYPNRPVRVIVPQAAGGGVDVVARSVTQKLTETWGQQVVIDNRSGAAGNIANDIVAKSAADGYTLLLGTVSTISINPSLFPKLPFDPVADFQPVSLVVSGFYLLAAHPGFQASSVRDLVALAKAKPGQLNYASGGGGSAPHLAMELLKQMARIEVAHVPYKGTGPALTDVVAGHVPMLFGSAVSILQLQKTGRVKVLAMTGKQRSKSMPDIPTVAESGFPGFEVDSWYGILAPARTSRPILTALHREIVRATQAPDVRSRFVSLGLEPVASTPEEFARIIKEDLARWAKVVKAGNIRAD